jgi:hypothetical protein
VHCWFVDVVQVTVDVQPVTAVQATQVSAGPSTSLKPAEQLVHWELVREVQVGVTAQFVTAVQLWQSAVVLPGPKVPAPQAWHVAPPNPAAQTLQDSPVQPVLQEQVPPPVRPSEQAPWLLQGVAAPPGQARQLAP